MGATPIKAIETRYAGCLFRSRLEARWAVFFDTLGITWQYEPQGYELQSGNYLPDFYLPRVKGGTWFEVKGQELEWGAIEIELAIELGESTGQAVLVATGDIPRDPGNFDSDSMWRLGDWNDRHFRWCCCTHCGRFGAEFEGRAARLGCGCYGVNADRGHNYDDPRILHAYEAARSARFEHGQSGAR